MVEAINISEQSMSCTYSLSVIKMSAKYVCVVVVRDLIAEEIVAKR